jgi:hypothetical protein
MLIFGTIGALVRSIPLPPGEIALLRGLVGVIFLIPVFLLKGRHFPWNLVAKRAPLILFAGIALCRCHRICGADDSSCHRAAGRIGSRSHRYRLLSVLLGDAKAAGSLHLRLELHRPSDVSCCLPSSLWRDHDNTPGDWCGSHYRFYSRSWGTRIPRKEACRTVSQVETHLELGLYWQYPFRMQASHRRRGDCS